jgi:hypothetical protein
MAGSQGKKQLYKDLKDRIRRLEKAARELAKLDVPQEVFGAELESIKSKLKSPSQVDEVERDIDSLKQRVASHQASLKQAANAEYEAKTALDVADYRVEQARMSGRAVPEAEAALARGREVLKRKDYPLALELATEAQDLARHGPRETPKPQITVNLDTQGYRAGEWKAVDLGIANRGKGAAESIELRFSPEVEVKLLRRLAGLEAGAMEIMEIGLKPKEAGDIPLDIEVDFRDADGNPYTAAQRFWLKVGGGLEMRHTMIDADLGAGMLPRLERYTIERKIGSGGFADVYLGRSVEGRTAAVKVPRLSQYETIEANDFVGEAELWSKLSRLSLPYIVELFEYGTSPYPWIAMEYMEGGALRDRMDRLGSKSCLEIAVKLMEALHSAHHHGVIHRDIKPENVLFDSHDTPKLTDWGLGKILLDASNSSVGFRGTVVYSAPEQLAGSRFGSVDWRTDIYQMGVLVYELITGKLPFGGSEAGTTITSILNEPPPAPSEASSQISPEMNDAVLRAMAKRKEDRFQSMDAFMDSVNAALKVL